MSRTNLLGAASAVALACIATTHAYAAAPQMLGGGSTLAQFDYIAEMTTFNQAEGNLKPNFAAPGSSTPPYWEAGSGSGQNGFLYDDITCDSNKVLKLNGGFCTGSTNSGPGNTGGGSNSTVYGASDATFSASQIAFWGSSTASFGQSLSGNLIQLPSMGIGVSFPVNDTNFAKDGEGSLTDHDLCEIFSGGYSDFSQITDATALDGVTPFTYAPGQFKVVYRTDGSGTTFVTTNHLATVCTTGTDTPAGFTFFATTTFATLFGGTPPGSTTANIGSNDGKGNVLTGMANPAGQSGSSGIANYLSGLTSAGAVPQAIAYLTPDFTDVDPNSFATLSNGNTSSLVIASVPQGGTPKLPTVAQISLALANPGSTGTALTPPTTGAEGAIASNWVPLIPAPTKGYPVVGYTTLDFAQCYANAAVSTAVIAFMKDHYAKKTTSAYYIDQNDNGFVPVTKSAIAGAYYKAILTHILGNAAGTAKKPAWNDDIGDTTVCKANGGSTYAGR